MKRAWARLRPKFEKARAKGAATKRSLLDPVVAAMHAEYSAGMGLNAVGRKYGRHYGGVRDLFRTRGLAVRPPKMKIPPKGPDGRILPARVHTAREISEIIARAATLSIPKELSLEWRKWPLPKKGEFIARLRARLGIEGMPRTPLSAGLEAFDYASEKAHAICRVLNTGRDSRTRRSALKAPSQGVIFRGELWFWSVKIGYQKWLPWTPENGRPALHRVLWEEYNGRRLRTGDVVRFADGNRNNFSRENLILATQNDVARENQAVWLTKKSREMTSLLLKRSQRKDKHADIISTLK